MDKLFVQLNLGNLEIIPKRATSGGKWSEIFDLPAVIAYPNGGLAFTPGAISALGNPTHLLFKKNNTGIVAFVSAASTSHQAYKVGR